MLFKIKNKDEYLRLVTKRESDVNTYLEVDKNNKPIIEKRPWGFHPSEQQYIIKGFDNLELIKD